MTTTLHVKQAGPFVSIQDKGRVGHMRFGVPRSGPMDRLAFLALQGVLRGDEAFAAIEVSVAGVRLRCEGDPVTAAVVGGKFHVERDGEALAPWSVFTLVPGQTLTVRGAAEGSWAYLGFAGNLAAPTWLGSKATHLNSGLCGRPLEAGDQLTVFEARLFEHAERDLPIPGYSRFCGSVRVVLGPQDSLFAQEAIQALSEQEFRITPNYNRMGMALDGPRLPIDEELTMPSEALVRGSVQVMGDGEALVLMADHQTTGGYPKIATVLSADVNQLAQARPGDALRFRAVGAEDAVRIHRRARVLFDSYIDDVSRR